MLTILTILIVIVGIMLSIVLHEFGHFVPARLFKVPCPQFFIGFGPKLWQKEYKGTLWSIKPIWLGGATEIAGMVPPPHEGQKIVGNGPIGKLIRETREESLNGIPEGQEDKAFFWLSTPKKIIVMAGGILMNLLLAIILLSISFGVIGTKVATNKIEEPALCLNYTIDNNGNYQCPVNKVMGTPATKLGLKKGDIITSINKTPVQDFSDISNVMSSLTPGSKNVEITYVKSPQVQGGSTLTKSTLFNPEFIDGSAKIGIRPVFEQKNYSIIELPSIIGTYIWGTMKAIVSIPVGLYQTVASIFTHTQRGANSLISIVGLGQVAVAGVNNSDSFSQGLFTILSLLGSLNIALFVFNLIPLLPLDGGHVLNACYEGVKRTIARIRKKDRPYPSDLARSMPLGYIVFILLLVMGVIIILADILNPIV